MKGGGSPPAAGTTMSTHLQAFCLHHNIVIEPESNLRDLEELPPLPPRL
jgi:hypothetical protein